MAFNFNWSPLTADASFYTRAKDLLTAALNKSPKPPIIVDDILVNELNLGSVPPDLEILEIGDLAEDRFRGIFKMCYTGDAFLTLKTRVQANPLNTYLSTTPSFTSPQPLAASSGLTIPLQITLSEIRLSAFIILVFSRQKGLTLVFRNDPLESLKVSSTFDSIPFVRDYLQKEIEGQLRSLLMEEVPAIIHRLSLRLWVPEFRAQEDEEIAQNNVSPPLEEQVTNPLAEPPQDPVDLSGHALDATQIASLSSDSSAETYSLFSQKNLLRLAALTDSHRTLSLFTPGLRDVVHRAWVSPTERGEFSGSNTPLTSVHSVLSRKHSYNGSTGTICSFPDGTDTSSLPSRPGLSNYGSSVTGLNLGAGRHGKPGRKRKHRVVNLRKPKSSTEDLESISGEGSISATVSSGASDFGFSASVSEEREGELITPPNSPRHKVHFQKNQDIIDLGDTSPNLQDLTPRPPELLEQQAVEGRPRPPLMNLDMEHPKVADPSKRPQLHQSRYFASYQYPSEKAQTGPFSAPQPQSSFISSPFPYQESSPGGILEQAWMMKMAGEIARRVQEQKSAESGFWDRAAKEDLPPPAYGL